jgi:ABC-type antimicrobial peptide transport system permease subunit
VPVVAMLLLVPVALVLVNAVAALPARRAARISPALALRTE